MSAQTLEALVAIKNAMENSIAGASGSVFIGRQQFQEHELPAFSIWADVADVELFGLDPAGADSENNALMLVAVSLVADDDNPLLTGLLDSEKLKAFIRETPILKGPDWTAQMVLKGASRMIELTDDEKVIYTAIELPLIVQT